MVLLFLPLVSLAFVSSRAVFSQTTQVPPVRKHHYYYYFIIIIIIIIIIMKVNKNITILG